MVRLRVFCGVGVLGLAMVVGGAKGAVDRAAVEKLGQRISFLDERLTSKRWQVRYALVGELTGADAATKAALETLIVDENETVAHQALMKYLDFLEIDKKLFKAEKYLLGKYPVKQFPAVGG